MFVYVHLSLGMEGCREKRGRFLWMSFWEALYRGVLALTRVAIMCRMPPPVDFLWQTVPFQPCCGHVKPPSSLMPAVPGDSEISDSVTLLIRLLLDDVPEFNDKGKGTCSEAFSAMPWIQGTAECRLQVEAAHLSSHLHILMHCESPHNKQNQRLVSTPVLK